MVGTRYEDYEHIGTGLPFVLNTDLERSSLYHSKEENWHEELEIQLITSGEGSVLLDGTSYPVKAGDVVVANSGVLHYTDTDGYLTYDCLILQTAYCKEIGIDPTALSYKPIVSSDFLASCISRLKSLYFEQEHPCRIAQLHRAVLDILIELTTRHLQSSSQSLKASTKALECVKSAIRYIRENYRNKLTLECIAKELYVDKFTLCRNFKRIAGETVFEYLNRIRCIRAAEHIAAGYTVTEAADASGYESLSYFAKSFKKYIGVLPSKFKP